MTQYREAEKVRSQRVKSFCSCFVSLMMLGSVQAEPEVVAALNGLAFRVLRSSWNPSANGVVSTLGFIKSLSLLYHAARNETRSEFQSMFNGLAPEPVQALVRQVEAKTQVVPEVNLWWYERVNDTSEYRRYLESFQKVTWAEVDFAAKSDEVNASVDQWGRQRLALDGIEPVNPADFLTRIVLADGTAVELVFKPLHSKSLVVNGAFNVDAETTKQCTQLVGLSTVLHGQFGDVLVFEAPLSNSELSLLVIVPPVGKLDELMTQLDVDKLDLIDEEMIAGPGVISLPELDGRTWTNGRDRLAKLGISRALSGVTCDLSGIDGNPGWLYLNDYVHGVTLSMAPSAEEPGEEDQNIDMFLPPSVLSADRPFTYLVRDRASGLILIAGWMVRPVTSQKDANTCGEQGAATQAATTDEDVAQEPLRDEP